MRHQALHLPCWSVFVPALFPTAVSQLLSFMLACQRVREQLQSQSPDPGTPEVDLVRGLRLKAGAEGVPFLGSGERS